MSFGYGPPKDKQEMMSLLRKADELIGERSGKARRPCYGDN